MVDDNACCSDSCKGWGWLNFKMGFERDWLKVWTMLFFCAFVQGSEKQRRDSLDSFVYDYTMRKLSTHPRTGTLYGIALPANLSGMDVSFIRLRARSLWRNGANYSSFEIPQYTIPWPFSRRVDIVYQNLGNLSSSYYDVPHHNFVTPVLGFLTYNPNASSPNNGLIELKPMGGDPTLPIMVWFPSLSSQKANVSRKCVRFDLSGTLEFNDMTNRSGCIVRKQGHFSVVIPHQPNKAKVSKWKVVGIFVGAVGLLLLVALGIAAFRWINRKRMKKMERQSERSESLDSIWVGRSKMPSAASIRTQPVIENNYAP